MKLKLIKLATGFVTAILIPVLFASPVAAADPVEIILGGGGATPWTISGIKPGDSGSQTITVQNAGTDSGDLTIWISNITDTEGVNPESETGDTAEPGELSGYILFSVTSARLGTNITMPSLITSLPQSSTDTNYLIVLSLAAGETVSIIWDWSLPAETGNEIQGDSLSFDINYLLEQLEPPPTTEPPATTSFWPPSWWTFPPEITTPPTTSEAPAETTATITTTPATTAPPTGTAGPPPVLPTQTPPVTGETTLPSTATQPPVTTTATTTNIYTGLPLPDEISVTAMFWIAGGGLVVTAILTSLLLAGKRKKRKKEKE